MALLIILLVLITGLYIKKFIDHRKVYLKYKDIVDIDVEVAKSDEELNKLKAKYSSSRELYKKLKEEIMILEGEKEMSEFGIYKPHFDFDTSEEYKEKIKAIREKQKEAIKDKSAIKCFTEWNIEGSRAKGRASENQYMRLMLRAFNNECDASILKVKWNNIQTMEARIEKSFDIVNKLGTKMNIYIQDIYLELKNDEIRLAYEYQQKKQEEKEEQREIREQMREEEKLRAELMKAEKEAQRDEKALEKARKELEKAHGEESIKLQEMINKLESELKDKERAISRAQLTKAGHVYVISNIGSFGNEIYKIGMTRRLEPMLRVKELGDASVPFPFDVHAMIFSDNAPELEKQLHNVFNEKRVNMANRRKEYFRVGLAEIESIVQQNNAEIEFTKIAEAQEYYQTLQIVDDKSNNKTIDDIIEEEFPEEL